MKLCKTPLIALLIASALLCSNLVAAGERRPNIVVIMADDMGYSDAGCFGGEIATPHIDRLAAGGIRFTQFYNTSRCCPTRAALLTGLYPHQAGMGHMNWKKLDLPGYRADLSHDTPTLAEILKPAGYSTYMTGKWHLTINRTANDPKDNWPRQRGFERYYGTIIGSGSFYTPRMLVRENEPVRPKDDPQYKPQRYYYTDAIADQSARSIREHDADAPFFLYVAFTAPHWPLHAPPEAVAKYRGKYDAGYDAVRAARFERMKKLGLIDDRWQLSPAPGEWSKQQDKAWEARCMEVYAAQIEKMDDGIGQIIAALEASNQLDNTLILFLQDNGACEEDKERKRVGVMPGNNDTYMSYGRNWANVSNSPFREYKHWVHEGGISTPLIAHWPAGIAKERSDAMEKRIGHVTDLVPTCLDAASVKAPGRFNDRATKPLAGISLAPSFSASPSTPPERTIYFEHEGNRAMRQGQWKLVAKGVKGAWELYDIEADRTEMHDLAREHPQRVAEMSAAWQQWAQANDVLPLRPWDDPAAPAEY